MEKTVLVEISARHLHVSQKDLEVLFGKGYEVVYVIYAIVVKHFIRLYETCIFVVSCLRSIIFSFCQKMLNSVSCVIVVLINILS